MMSESALKELRPRLQRGDGGVTARFGAALPGMKTGARLLDLYQSDPGRALLPLPEPGEPASLVLVTTSGGLTGGDRLKLSLTLEAGAKLAAMAQAAEKLYRSAAADSETEVIQELSAASGAWLEWLPQETILFNGARLARRTSINLDPEAEALIGDMLVYGRVARGERFEQGSLFDLWELRRAGRLVWTERQGIDGDIAALLAAPAGFDGAVAQASLIFARPGFAAETGCTETLAGLRTILEHHPGLRGGATRLDGFILLRLLGRDPLLLRRAFAEVWRYCRHQAGWADTMPRLWLR